MKDQITKLLKEKLHASQVDVRDDSAKHAGHAEAQKSGGGHYSVVVVSESFKGKNLVERHRMVYEALAPLKDKIHALAIKAVVQNIQRS